MYKYVKKIYNYNNEDISILKLINSNFIFFFILKNYVSTY